MMRRHPSGADQTDPPLDCLVGHRGFASTAHGVKLARSEPALAGGARALCCRACPHRRPPRGLSRRLTRYGDEAFARFLREAFLESTGLSREAFDRPVVGIASTASDFNPVSRHRSRAHRRD